MQIREVAEVRIDKWLWSVRIFKSRSQATDACKSGKVRVGDKAVKPSYSVHVGDHLEVVKNGFRLQFDVRKLIDRRVSATLAAPCYTDRTPIEELNKFKDWFIGKGAAERRDRGSGRPTKRDRRTLDDYKEDLYAL